MADPDAAVPLLWMGPLLSGGGYSSEAIAFALGLLNLTRLDAAVTTTALAPRPGIGISFAVRQFAEPPDEVFLSGLPRSGARQLEQLFAAGWSDRAASGVVVCHSTPDAWVPSRFPGWDEVAPCPPPEAKIKVSATGQRGEVGPRKVPPACCGDLARMLRDTAALSERRPRNQAYRRPNWNKSAGNKIDGIGRANRQHARSDSPECRPVLHRLAERCLRPRACRQAGPSGATAWMRSAAHSAPCPILLLECPF
jgi:hypothetical protein